MRQRLSPDTMLSITLDAICSRNRYTTDPAPVIAELHATAGDRADILTASVGICPGSRPARAAARSQTNGRRPRTQVRRGRNVALRLA